MEQTKNIIHETTHSHQRTSKRKPLIPKMMAFGVLCLLTVVMLYPFFYMAETSLRSLSQFEVGVGFSFQSWVTAFQSVPIVREMINSTIVTFGSIFLIVTFATTGGYAFSKLPFKGSGVLFVGIVASMMIPVQSMIIPEYINISRLGLIDHYLGAILVFAALGSPFATFLMTTYFRGIPNELMEAAVMDGLSYGKIFLRIMLPLSIPAIATIVILQFINGWNDLLIGLLFLQNPSVRTITVGIATMASSRVLNIPTLMVVSLVSAGPAIAVYFIFQRYLISGLTMGMGK